MLKRLIVVMMLALAPLTAHADEMPVASPTPSATPTPAASQPDPAASTLGPSAAGGGGSSADGSALQPAGITPLQSTTTDSTGLTAPNANTLQAPAGTGDALKVLAGEADGATHAPAGTSSSWGWLWWTVLFAALLAATLFAIRPKAFTRIWRRYTRTARRPKH